MLLILFFVAHQGPMLSFFNVRNFCDFIALEIYISVDNPINRKYFITRQLNVVIHGKKFVVDNIGPEIIGMTMSPVPIKINGQLLTTEQLNPKEHQIIFRRMSDYATDVTFHHIHIPVLLGMINKVADMAIAKIRSYAVNVYQESMMHYHEDNQYADTKKGEGYAKLIADQNLFVIQESKNSIKYFQEDLKSAFVKSTCCLVSWEQHLAQLTQYK
jgi:hypothetical protein